MSALDTAKEFLRIGSTAGLSKDVIDLLEKKAVLLAEQVATLEDENSHLKLENAKLRQQIRNLQPVAHGLSDEQVHILKLLNQEQENTPTAKVAARISLDVPRVEYLIVGLRYGKYILDFPTGLRITDKGRIFVNESLV